jgi:lauroyl/myristoyl acyltransferase
MAEFRVDSLAVWKQRILALAPVFLGYPVARDLMLKLTQPTDPREIYLASMLLEVVWLSETYLKRNFIHSGADAIDPEEPFVITSLHFGQWGMYPASLYQQSGVASQMIITGRNQRPDSPVSYFWHRFGHLKQHLSGYPGRYSTEGFFKHKQKLESGISQIVMLDVRERGLPQKELALEFAHGPYYLPRTVPLLARRAKARILPYIGYYDIDSEKHKVTWFPPLSAKSSDKSTLQEILELFEPVFTSHPEFYFNVLSDFRMTSR